jgi:hypothetical protein
MTGSKHTPRKRTAAAAPAASGLDAVVDDIQDIRRGILALVEVGREVSNTSPLARDAC